MLSPYWLQAWTCCDLSPFLSVITRSCTQPGSALAAEMSHCVDAILTQSGTSVHSLLSKLRTTRRVSQTAVCWLEPRDGGVAYPRN